MGRNENNPKVAPVFASERTSVKQDPFLPRADEEALRAAAVHIMESRLENASVEMCLLRLCVVAAQQISEMQAALR